MTKPLLFELEAEEELEDAALWYEQQKRGLGARLLAEVVVAVDQVRRFPQSGAVVPSIPANLPARRVVVKGFPYHVVYLDTPAAIHILAFAHHRRRPGYWVSRHTT